MADLGCLFVCMFRNYLMPVLIAAHTANNVDFGDEPENEDESYESEGPQNFSHHKSINKKNECRTKVCSMKVVSVYKTTLLKTYS